MARIPVSTDVPGIRSLFAFRPETAPPLLQLAETLLRGPSTLSSGEREIIAAVVSTGNECAFCARSHAAAASAHLGDEKIVAAACARPEDAGISPKLKALLRVALQVRESGRAVKDADVARARAEGATDLEIHDTVLIAAAFCMFNRYVDGLQAATPDDPDAYRAMGKRMAFEGYTRRA